MVLYFLSFDLLSAEAGMDPLSWGLLWYVLFICSFWLHNSCIKPRIFGHVQRYCISLTENSWRNTINKLHCKMVIDGTGQKNNDNQLYMLKENLIWGLLLFLKKVRNETWYSCWFFRSMLSYPIVIAMNGFLYCNFLCVTVGVFLYVFWRFGNHWHICDLHRLIVLMEGYFPPQCIFRSIVLMYNIH